MSILYNEGSVGRLSQNDYKSAVPLCTIIEESQLTKATTIPELLNDANLNTLVRLPKQYNLQPML